MYPNIFSSQHIVPIAANLLSPGAAKENPLGGILPTVGQTSKKKKLSSTNGGSNHNEGKDENGCIRVPGFTGVWVNSEGKHFVKVDGQLLTNPSNEESITGSGENEVILFDNAEEAAKKHDVVVTEKWGNKGNELRLNFNDDGSRIVYDTTSTAAAGRNLEMLGNCFTCFLMILTQAKITKLSLFIYKKILYRWWCIKCKCLLSHTNYLTIIIQAYNLHIFPINVSGGTSIVCHQYKGSSH